MCAEEKGRVREGEGEGSYFSIASGQIETGARFGPAFREWLDVIDQCVSRGHPCTYRSNEKQFNGKKGEMRGDSQIGSSEEDVQCT